jgi:hypothetical protein
MPKDCWFGKRPLSTAALLRQKKGALASASPAEARLAEESLEAVKVPRSGEGRFKKRPARLIGDKGDDSDPLPKRLKYLKIELIAPHKSNRKKPKTQDGRKLRQ